jgi:cell division protein FtsL
VETALLVIALCFSLLATAGSLYALYRSAPIQLANRADAAYEQAEKMEDEFRRLKVSNANWLDEASNVLETVEHKRRQVSARASKQNAEPATPEEERAYWEQRARAQGLLQ